MYKFGMSVEQDLNKAKKIFKTLKEQNEDAVELFYYSYDSILDKLRLENKSSLFSIAKATNSSSKSYSKLKPIGPYKALLIAIEDYSFLDGLLTPINDIQNLEKTLEKKYGFTTTKLINPDHKKLFFEISKFLKSLSPEDSALIYFAGHGKKLNNRSFWMPIDAEIDNDFNWFDTDRLIPKLDKSKSRNILIVADSCYSGTITRGANNDVSKISSTDSNPTCWNLC